MKAAALTFPRNIRLTYISDAVGVAIWRQLGEAGTTNTSCGFSFLRLFGSPVSNVVFRHWYWHIQFRQAAVSAMQVLAFRYSDLCFVPNFVFTSYEWIDDADLPKNQTLPLVLKLHLLSNEMSLGTEGLGRKKWVGLLDLEAARIDRSRDLKTAQDSNMGRGDSSPETDP